MTCLEDILLEHQYQPSWYLCACMDEDADSIDPEEWVDHVVSLIRAEFALVRLPAVAFEGPLLGDSK